MSERGNVPTQPDGDVRWSSRTNLTLDTFVDSVASEGPAAAAHSGSGRSCARARARRVHTTAEGPADGGAEMGMGMGWRVKKENTEAPLPPCLRVARRQAERG